MCFLANATAMLFSGTNLPLTLSSMVCIKGSCTDDLHRRFVLRAANNGWYAIAVAILSLVWPRCFICFDVGACDSNIVKECYGFHVRQRRMKQLAPPIALQRLLLEILSSLTSHWAIALYLPFRIGIGKGMASMPHAYDTYMRTIHKCSFECLQCLRICFHFLCIIMSDTRDNARGASSTTLCNYLCSIYCGTPLK